MNKAQTRKIRQVTRELVAKGKTILEGEFVKRAKRMPLLDRLRFAWIIVRGR